MDIQVASNFERFLYYYFDQDSQRLTQFMQDFAAMAKPVSVRRRKKH